MSRLTRFSTLFFTLFAAAIAFAAEPPTITITKQDSLPLSMGSFTGPDGPVIARIVQNDLARSGFFSFSTNPGAMVISGGGSFEGKVTDHSGGNVLLRSYSGGVQEKAHAFANDIIETLTGARGMAGSKIAFIATRSGRKELYTANHDGSNVTRVTSDGSISVAPSISPDGQRVAYTSYLQSYADIYSVNLATGARDRIVKYPGTNSGAAFSPNGSQIACTISKDGNPEIYIFSSGGGGGRRITRSTGVQSSPTWSPDGRELIYSSDSRGGGPQLYRVSSGGGEGQRLATGYGYCTKPHWSPDGKKVAFNVRDGGQFAVAVLHLESGAVKVVARDGAQDPVWGPDSRHLLFSQSGALIMLDAQSGQRVKALDGYGAITEPSWTR